MDTCKSPDAQSLTRRRELVRRLAAQILARSAQNGEQHLAAQLRRQAASLRRKGFADNVVRRELEEITSAVRREIWRAVLCTPPFQPRPQRATGARSDRSKETRSPISK